MRKCVEFLVLVLMLAISAACTGKSSSSRGSGDTVQIATVTVADTAHFAMKSGMKCNMTVTASIAYPENLGKTTEDLQTLFAQIVLEASDSTDFNTALKGYASSILNYEGDDTGDDAPDSDEEATFVTLKDNTLNYVRTIEIAPKFNKEGIITFCKFERIEKNGVETLSEHSYYNFDINAVKLIEVEDVFSADGIEEMNRLLRETLLQQNGVATEDELGTLGYYNLDNLTVTGNFFMNERGVTWSFKPNELAIMRVGEPQVFLGYEKLKDFLADNSPLKRF